MRRSSENHGTKTLNLDSPGFRDLEGSKVRLKIAQPQKQCERSGRILDIGRSLERQTSAKDRPLSCKTTLICSTTQNYSKLHNRRSSVHRCLEQCGYAFAQTSPPKNMGTVHNEPSEEELARTSKARLSYSLTPNGPLGRHRPGSRLAPWTRILRDGTSSGFWHSRSKIRTSF